MFKNSLCASLLLISVSFAGATYAAEDPSMHQIYQAAESGHLDDAQAMMQKVLQDHPNSAKAHFVEAELLAKQGKLSSAASELERAEQLAPGLPFAKPDAVQLLKTRIAGRAVIPAPTQAYAAPAQNAGTPWAMIILGGGIIFAIIYFARSISRRNAPAYMPAANGYGPVGTPNGGGVMPASGSGMGSNILGGLATGAAMGAGVVAGEALIHHFIDGERPNDLPHPQREVYESPPDNFGGNDFGIDNSSSWDDSSGDSGGDWG